VTARVFVAWEILHSKCLYSKCFVSQMFCAEHQRKWAGTVVGGRGLDFSLIPPGPVETRTTRMVVSAAVFGILIILSD
jgi:hypothetical protein